MSASDEPTEQRLPNIAPELILQLLGIAPGRRGIRWIHIDSCLITACWEEPAGEDESNELVVRVIGTLVDV